MDDDMASAVPAPGSHAPHEADKSSSPSVSIPDAWTAIDVENPPSMHVIAIYADNSGAQILSKFDGDRNFHHAEDSFALDPQVMAESFSVWCAAPADFRPHFMEITPEDWR